MSSIYLTCLHSYTDEYKLLDTSFLRDSVKGSIWELLNMFLSGCQYRFYLYWGTHSFVYYGSILHFGQLSLLDGND